MSITLEQIVQTLESLPISERRYTIVYYLPGFDYRFDIVKRESELMSLTSGEFNSRSIEEFAAIRDHKHYISSEDYPVRFLSFPHMKYKSDYIAQKILDALNNHSTHREAYWITERLRLPRGPLKNRNTSIEYRSFQAESLFHTKKVHEHRVLEEYRGIDKPLMPQGLKLMILDENDATNNNNPETEAEYMHMAKRVILFHNLHGQFPEA